MTRVKRGVVSHQKHKKVLAATAGYRMTKNRLIKVAREAQLHAGEYAFHGRHLRKRDMRRLWIGSINAQLLQANLQYNQFVSALKKAHIQIDRKILADLAIKNPHVFKAVVDQAREHVH